MSTPSLKRHIIESVVVAVVLTGLSYIVAALVGWITEVNWLEVFAVFTSYACTYLGVKQRRINYIVAIITTSAYCILFYQWGLISSMILQVYLIPTVIYGYIRWGKDRSSKPVEYAVSRPKWVPVYLGVTLIVYGGAVALSSALGGAFATLDAIILAGTVLAQFLMDNKKRETWIIWAIVNIVAIYLYFTSGLYLAAFQYVFFLANTLYGWSQWKVAVPRFNLKDPQFADPQAPLAFETSSLGRIHP